VCRAYNVQALEFGPDYIIPKPLDPRVLVEESIAVAIAAMKTNVARHPLHDLDKYRSDLTALSARIALHRPPSGA
jgi:malate dehydrogenase (oxaloacetate-decarboxylating)(NADP+)